MKSIYIMLIGLLPLLSFGQNLRYIPSQPLLESSVENGFFVSRQSFQIRDKETGELFGLNGKEEFGVQYSIGIKIPDGILLMDEAVRPWEYNAKFEKYSEKYDPVLHQSDYSKLTKPVEYKTLDLHPDTQKMLVDSLLYMYGSESFDGKGFLLDKQTGEKEGWVVWVISRSSTDLETSADVNYIIYQKKLTVKSQGQSFEIEKPYADREVLGGVYVVPRYTEIGIVEFRLCGIIVPKNENSWVICCPFADNEDIPVVSGSSFNEKEKDNQASELTPIGSDKKDSKKNKKKDRK